MKSLAAALISLGLFAMPALADAPSPPTLQANGQGTATVTPDIAIVTLGVTTRGNTASGALTQNSTQLAAAIQAIEATGIAEKDIGTSGLNIYPVYAQNADGSEVQPPKVIGYDVSNEVTVTIRDITTAGDVLDKVVTAGANRVNGISFDVADRKTPADAALKDAIADATRKAGIMADAAGVKLVRILSITAESGGEPPRAVLAMAKVAGSAVPIMPGQQDISANATVTWEIAPQ